MLATPQGCLRWDCESTVPLCNRQAWYVTGVIVGEFGVSDEGEETYWSRLMRPLTDHHNLSPRRCPRYGIWVRRQNPLSQRHGFGTHPLARFTLPAKF